MAVIIKYEKPQKLLISVKVYCQTDVKEFANDTVPNLDTNN